MSTQQVQTQETPTQVNMGEMSLTQPYIEKSLIRQDQPQEMLDSAPLPFQIIEIQLTQEDVERRITEYEAKYGLTSEEFYQLWLKGEGPDTVDTGGWAMIYEILQERNSHDLE